MVYRGVIFLNKNCLSKMAWVVMFLTYICGVNSSNPWLLAYPDWGFFWFCCKQVISSACSYIMITSFQIISHVLFISYPMLDAVQSEILAVSLNKLQIKWIWVVCFYSVLVYPLRRIWWFSLYTKWDCRFIVDIL